MPCIRKSVTIQDLHSQNVRICVIHRCICTTCTYAAAGPEQLKNQQNQGGMTMKKQVKKGYPAGSGKRWLALFMCI